MKGEGLEGAGWGFAGGGVAWIGSAWFLVVWRGGVLQVEPGRLRKSLLGLFGCFRIVYHNNIIIMV